MTHDLSYEATPRDQLWRSFILAAACLMAAAALYRIPIELGRLAFEPMGQGAAHDFFFRFRESREWFAGRPIYGVVSHADYPPATYVMLFPFTSWSLNIARLVWAGSMVGALAWLFMISVRECAAKTTLERAFVVLLPLCSYATAATIRVGQIGLHILPALIAGLLILANQERSWKRDLTAAVLLVFALAKPTFSVPFFWIAFFVGGVRLTTLVVAGYVALSWWSSSFQPDSLAVLVQKWLAQGSTISSDTAHGNIQSWMANAGIAAWNLQAPLLVLGAAGIWTWLYRRADVWLLIGVASIVARMWAHHRWYDDVLLIPPLVTLYRMISAGERAGKRDAVAMALFAIVLGFSIAPARFLDLETTVSVAFKAAKSIAWVALLVEILIRTQRAYPLSSAHTQPASAGSLPARPLGADAHDA
jgi:glycosyl transferase family 87